MKYIKLFLLVALVGMFVSCSSDDDNNTTDAVVTLSSTSLNPKESVRYFNVPIEVKGERNGLIKVHVTATPAVENPAIEDVHYLITSKEILIPANEDVVFNIEIKAVDDSEINVDRKFTISITAEGATVENASTEITLRDNDNAIYEKFAGKWVLERYEDYAEKVISTDVTISAASDETDKDYNKILYGTCTDLMYPGLGLTWNWNMEYAYDPVTKKGTIGFVMGELNASMSSYTFYMFQDGGASWSTDTASTSWILDSSGNLPNEITFDPELTIYMVDPALGWFSCMNEMKLRRK